MWKIMADNLEIFNVAITLTKHEAETLRKIRATIKKEDGSDWGFDQILSELISISLENWHRMQLIKKLTPFEAAHGN